MDQQKCVKYLVASDFADDRTKCIRDVMNYFWTEEDGISDERTELVEDAVDELINLGYEPYKITGRLVSCNTDSSLNFTGGDIQPVGDTRRQEIINEYLPLDTRVKRWSIDGEDDPDEEYATKVAILSNLAEEFDAIAEEIFIKIQDKDVLKLKMLTASAQTAAKTGKLTEEQIDGSIEEITHNLNLLRLALNEDDPEPIGPTFKGVCPFHSGSDSPEVDNAVWELIGYLSESLDPDECNLNAFNHLTESMLKNFTITVEYNG